MSRANNVFRGVLAALATLCVASAAAAANLTIGLATDITSLDPHFHNVTPNNSVGFHIFGFLVKRDDKLHLVPRLATEWKAIDPTTWEFKLSLIHISEPTRQAEISYAVSCLKKT